MFAPSLNKLSYFTYHCIVHWMIRTLCGSLDCLDFCAGGCEQRQGKNAIWWGQSPLWTHCSQRPACDWPARPPCGRAWCRLASTAEYFYGNGPETQWCKSPRADFYDELANDRHLSGFLAIVPFSHHDDDHLPFHPLRASLDRTPGLRAGHSVSFINSLFQP